MIVLYSYVQDKGNLLNSIEPIGESKLSVYPSMETKLALHVISYYAKIITYYYQSAFSPPA